MKNLCPLFIFKRMVLLTVLIGTCVYAENTSFPDSIHTQEYIEQICLSNPHGALKLIDEMEEQKLMSQFRLDNLRSLVYQNGLDMYRMALTYSLKAYHSDSIRQFPMGALQLLESITNQCNVTGNYTESTRYAVEGIELAKRIGDKYYEANMLLYIGINKRDMGLKDEAAPYVNQAIQMQEKLVEDCRDWHVVDNLIYTYGMKITFTLEDKKYQEAIDLLPRYEKLMERLKAFPDLPDGLYDMRLASGYAAYAYIFAADGQLDKGAAFYKKFEETDYSHTDDGNQMRFEYLIAIGHYREALQYIHTDKLYRKEQGDTINYSYLERNLCFEAQAYIGLGDYSAASNIYQQMYILSDSLRIREQRNGVLEFATIYETKEKEEQLARQTVRLREGKMILLFAIGIIGLLGSLLWRNIQHSRIIKAKNKAMAGTITGLLNYKEELYRYKEDNQLLRERVYKAESELQMQNYEVIATMAEASIENKKTKEDIDSPICTEETNNSSIPNGQELFKQVEHEIISRQLFLQSESSREELIKVLHIPKNKFSLLFKQYAGMSFSKYINKLRMEYASKLLLDHPEYSNEAIALSCGISSTTSFYRLFSEFYGMTPTELRENLKTVENEKDT